MKNELSRITIDIPTSIHKKFKSFAASEGKSMREVVLELIRNQVSNQSHQECPYSHVSNKKTKKILKNMLEGKEKLIEAENMEELIKKLRS